MNRDYFRAEMVRRGFKVSDVAEMLGIAENTLYRKLSEKNGEFTQREIAAIKNQWNLSNEDVINIFFN